MEITTNHSSGVAKAGLATGIVGTTLGVLNGAGGLLGMGNLMSRAANCNDCHAGYSENMFVNRYELNTMIANDRALMEKDLQIAELKGEVKFRDSTIYTDQKSIEFYKYVDGQFKEINATLAAQAVQNQATKDSFQIVNERLGCVQKELEGKICAEAKARQCADNTIVNYANNTFYPKLVADVTAGSTTTPQNTYNPLPVDTCDCDCR